MSVLYTVQSNMFVVHLLLHQFYLPGDWKKSQAFRPWSSWEISTPLISVCRPKQKSTTNPEIFLENENFLAQTIEELMREETLPDLILTKSDHYMVELLERRKLGNKKYPKNQDHGSGL